MRRCFLRSKLSRGVLCIGRRREASAQPKGSYQSLSCPQLSRLAVEQFREGYLSEAAATLRSLIERLEQTVSKNDASLLDPLQNLGNIYRELGDVRRRGECLHRARAISKQTYGKGHVHHGWALTNLASVYGDVGAYETQQKLLLEARDIIASAFGASHERMLRVMIPLSESAEGLGMFSMQKELLEHSLKTAHRRASVKPADVSMILNLLGRAHRNLKEHATQKRVLTEALAMDENTFGTHPQLALTINNLATAEGDLGNTEDQWALLDRALSISANTSVPRESANAKIVTLSNMAGAAAQRSDFGRSMSLQQRALSEAKALFASASPKLGNCLIDCAVIALQLKDFRHAYTYALDGHKVLDEFFKAAAKLENGAPKNRHPSLERAEGTLREAEQWLREHNMMK